MYSKKCVDCKGTKPLDAFPEAPANTDGRRGQCYTCVAAYYRVYRQKPGTKAKDKARRLKDAEKIKQQRIARKYGLSSEQHKALFAKQQGLCAICKKPGKLVVDHNHGTSQVRGLLHSQCNRAIGLLLDSPEVITAAASYVVMNGVL